MLYEIDWLNDLKPKLIYFLDLMSDENCSYYKYTLTGDLYLKDNDWGLGNLVFAAKILYISNLLDSFQEIKRKNIIDGILRFSKNDGYIYDEIVTSSNIIEILKNVLRKRNTENIRRAETRQAFAALKLLEAKPKDAFINIPYSITKAKKYLESFNWRYPWNAGSHFSHLMFFWNYNASVLSYRVEESKELIKYALSWIYNLQSKNDGSWYTTTDVSLQQKINGAMKVLTGLHAANIYEFPYPNKLIDTALSAVNKAHACDNFNVTYVLYSSNLIIPNYRRNEIEDYLIKRLAIYKKYYYPEIGGFSFFENRANHNYYGKKLSKGFNEPDIHGTTMFIWGISLINKIIDLDLDFKIPLN